MDKTLLEIKKNNTSVQLNEREVYQTLMASLLNPGEFQNLKEHPIPFFKPAIDFALQPLLSLLHSEVTFHIISRNPGLAELVTCFLENCTGAWEDNYEEADFLLCLEGTSRGRYAKIKACATRELYPNATIFYLVEKFSLKPLYEAVPLRLKGSGITEPKIIYIQGLDSWEVRSWIELRSMYIQETDIYLISAEGVLLKLPGILEFAA